MSKLEEFIAAVDELILAVGDEYFLETIFKLDDASIEEKQQLILLYKQAAGIEVGED